MFASSCFFRWSVVAFVFIPFASEASVLAEEEVRRAHTQRLTQGREDRPRRHWDDDGAYVAGKHHTRGFVERMGGVAAYHFLTRSVVEDHCVR